MSRYKVLLNKKSDNFFKKEVEFDDESFNFWKQELQKELPSFWEDVGGKFR